MLCVGEQAARFSFACVALILDAASLFYVFGLPNARSSRLLDLSFRCKPANDSSVSQFPVCFMPRCPCLLSAWRTAGRRLGSLSEFACAVP